MQAITSVAVTQHAWDQWRERAALYYDAPPIEAIDAIKASRLIPDDEPLPFRKECNCLYFFNEPTKCYFVTENLGKGRIRIITVIDPTAPFNYLLPKRRDKKKRLESSNPEVEYDNNKTRRQEIERELGTMSKEKTLKRCDLLEEHERLLKRGRVLREVVEALKATRKRDQELFTN